MCNMHHTEPILKRKVGTEWIVVCMWSWEGGRNLEIPRKFPSLKNTRVKGESLPEATEQFVVKLCHYLLLPHTKHGEAVAIPCPPFFSFFFSHFGACNGREGWSCDGWRPEARQLEWFSCQCCMDSEAQRFLLLTFLPLKGNFITGETRLHFLWVKYIGTSVVLLGINIACNV